MTKRPLSQFFGPRYWPTWVGLFILRLIALLPLPVVAVVGNVIGYLVYLLGASRRDIAFKNVRTCFPEKSDSECKKISRAHFLHAGQVALTSSMNWWVSSKRFNRWITLQNREIYDQAIAEGRNVILLAPHFLALEVSGLYLSQERPMATMYQYSKNTLIDEVVKRGRLRFGGALVERKEPLRRLLKLIRSGHPFIYLPDQDAGRKGIFVPFFGQAASTIPMLGKFAGLTNSVVIPCRTEIKPWGKGYHVVFGAPLEDFPLNDEVKDTTKMNQSIEEMIRQCPEQYFWAHKRFKTRPEGAPKFYN